MIGKVIKFLLTDSQELTDIVSEEKIQPYVLDKDTSLPAIIYNILSIKPDYTKDGWAGDDITFSVSAIAEHFDILQDIVFYMREALEFQAAEVDGVRIRPIRFDGFMEGYHFTESVFLTRLTFKTKMIKKEISGNEE